jgi:predicted aspartyl protease
MFLKMNKLLNLILLTATFNSIAIAAQAQNSDTCFMLDANGNSMNLGSLCQNSHPKDDRPSNSNPQRYQNNSNVYTVPIKSRRHGIPVIDVKFNNSHVFEMMLDTGASQIVITQQMAKTLKVIHYQDVWVSTPSNNLVAMSSGYLYSVGVANLFQPNPLVITSPTMDIGLLGQSFFSHYDLTIKSDVIEFRER